MSKVLVEVCCNSAGDVFRAQKGGAARVELNSALFLGGLTPSMGEFATSKKAGLPIMAMVRPREGGFCYDDDDFAVMLADAEALVKAGADGIVFGVLTAGGTVDVPRCKAMMDVIGPTQSVFHRAIDVVPDWRSALDDLIGLGFTRVLTSGQRKSVLDGAETVRQMRKYAAGRIEVSPGGGIHLDNVLELLERTGADQIHVSMRGARVDPSMQENGEIRFCGPVSPPEGSYSATDPGKLARLMKLLG